METGRIVGGKTLQSTKLSRRSAQGGIQGTRVLTALPHYTIARSDRVDGKKCAVLDLTQPVRYSVRTVRE